MSVPEITVVGTGPVGRAVVAAHIRGGGSVRAVISRSVARAAELARLGGGADATEQMSSTALADVVVVAVADRAVAEVGARIAAAVGERSPLVLHTSGALSGAALGGNGGDRLRRGSLHPLRALPRAPGDGSVERLAARLDGTHWFHEGAGADIAQRLVLAWRGTFHPLAPGTKTLYHAGAAVLSNHTVALFESALRLFERAGVARDDAAGPLAHLLLGTADNLREFGVPAALTGPIARGDVGTVAAHVSALRGSAPEELAAYRELARIAVTLARAKGGAAADDLDRIVALLDSTS